MAGVLFFTTSNLVTLAYLHYHYVVENAMHRYTMAFVFKLYRLYFL